MYDVLPSFILGFHGCDHVIAERIFKGNTALRASRNAYDWLGHGIYFWENNPRRALEWARQLNRFSNSALPRIARPAVVGAVIDLGQCLNLLDAEFIQLMKQGYRRLLELRGERREVPANRPLRGSSDVILRYLDCAVIEMLHSIRLEEGQSPFQSVRGVFVEGPQIYPGAGVHEFNHIQICVRDPRCIKGYFRVLKDPGPNTP